jgi:2,3-bisphosphoglycerate-independent phosphoglycerate mutase
MTDARRPLALIILDGWGMGEPSADNAVSMANTPVWDKLWQQMPHALVNASGASVGLPGDQMGNSEVGHMNMGAGRVVYQEFTRISRAVRTGSFFTNRTLTDAVDHALAEDKALHVLGLLSPGGVHSHEGHLQAMVKLAADRGLKKIYVHAFLDGRDTPPKSAQSSIEGMETHFKSVGAGQFASIIGRFYAMDRDQRWQRVNKAYQLITRGEADFQTETALAALDAAYARDEADEFVQATAIVPAGGAPVTVNDGDVVMFMNFRSDRARQLTDLFISPECGDEPRSQRMVPVYFVSLTEFSRAFDVRVAFPSEKIPNVLGKHLSQLGLRQLRIAETEKYAHVTFFFNGGRDEPYDGEDRILIPSPAVSTYNLKPEMSAEEVTDRLIETVLKQQYDVIICNYANADMVGHSGDFAAAVKAVEFLDTCLGRVWEAMQQVNGRMLITADHGNAEMMQDTSSGQAHTAHTSNLVPLLYVADTHADLIVSCEEGGVLADIAPTMLSLMGLPIPQEMTGRPLVRFASDVAEADE